MMRSVFLVAAVAFPVVLLLAVLGMERVEKRLTSTTRPEPPERGA